MWLQFKEQRRPLRPRKTEASQPHGSTRSKNLSTVRSMDSDKNPTTDAGSSLLGILDGGQSTGGTPSDSPMENPVDSSIQVEEQLKSANAPDGVQIAVYDQLKARLATSRVRLRPISPSDYDALRQIELGEQLGPLWRCRGATPSADSWLQSLSVGVLAQFLVLRADSGQAVGVVTCYQADFQNQFAYLAAAKFDRSDRSTRLLEGTVLFIDYVFRCWNFRKLYLEVAGYNLNQIQSGIGRLLVEEGRLKGHIFYDGQYWDQALLALWRSKWKASGFSDSVARIGTAWREAGDPA